MNEARFNLHEITFEKEGNIKSIQWTATAKVYDREHMEFIKLASYGGTKKEANELITWKLVNRLSKEL